jgi:hypothetical protein
MRANDGLGEDTPMTDEPQGLGEVEQRLQEIQRRKRGGIRWHISKHTAEMAIEALESGSAGPKPGGKSAKQRRRKKGKRLL